MKELTNKDLALLLTAYERYGSVNEDELKEMLIDEVLKPSLSYDDISDYNEYLIENNYETYMNSDDLDDYLQNCKPWEIIQMWNFGQNNYSDDYFKFNGYGNINSYSEYDIVKEMEDDSGFLSWLFDERNILDDYDSDEIIRIANELIKKGY